jgi:hypothetical protein
MLPTRGMHITRSHHDGEHLTGGVGKGGVVVRSCKDGLVLIVITSNVAKRANKTAEAN